MGSALSKAHCEVHGERVDSRRGLRCRRGHFVCGECLSNYITLTWQPAQRNLSAAQPEVRCLVPGCDAPPFAPTDVVREASNDAGTTYLRIRQQAEKARTLTEAQQLMEVAANSGNPVAQERARAQLLSLQLVNELPNALMCPKCRFGPVDHFGCDNLRKSKHNVCPACGFRGDDKAEWLKWDGKAPPVEGPPAATAMDPNAMAQQRKRAQTGPVTNQSAALAMLRRDRSETTASVSVNRSNSLTAGSLLPYDRPFVVPHAPNGRAATADTNSSGGFTVGAPVSTVAKTSIPDSAVAPAALQIVPPKYAKGVDGVRRLNPEYLEYQAARKKGQGGGNDDSAFRGATTLLCPQQALPVVSSMEEHEAHFPDTALAAKTDFAIGALQNPATGIPGAVGVPPDELVDELGRVFSKYEAPIGLVPKLLQLQSFEGLEFIIDDSGSMALGSDVMDRNGNALSRWREVLQRMTELIEILAYIPTGFIRLRFLNRKDLVVLRQAGAEPELPQTFILRATNAVRTVFQRAPSGGTPALQTIQTSLDAGRRVARYFFGDGQPDGGVADQRRITQLLTARTNAAANPFTFMSCTNDGAQTEWMKDCEEVAPFCAEYDDFTSEALEVRKDHGDALPYSLGIHLIAQLVGAISPEDLDALDESVPLTKYALDNLLGLVHSEAEYRHYFNCFELARQRRPCKTAADEVRKAINWSKHFAEFMKQERQQSIPAAVQFKKRLAAAVLL